MFHCVLDSMSALAWELLNYSRKPVAVSTSFVYDRLDFFVSELHLIQSSIVPLDTAIEFALCAKTFPQTDWDSSSYRVFSCLVAKNLFACQF